jgi:hypothetical protein
MIRITVKNADVYACVLLLVLTGLTVMLSQSKRDAEAVFDQSIEMTDELARALRKLKQTQNYLVALKEMEADGYYAKKENVIFPFTQELASKAEEDKKNKEEKKHENINIDLIVSQNSVPTVLIEGRFFKIGDKLNTGEKLYKVNNDSIVVKSPSGMVRTVQMKTQRNNAIVK